MPRWVRYRRKEKQRGKKKTRKRQEKEEKKKKIICMRACEMKYSTAKKEKKIAGLIMQKSTGWWKW